MTSKEIIQQILKIIKGPMSPEDKVLRLSELASQYEEALQEKIDDNNYWITYKGYEGLNDGQIDNS